MKQKALKPHCEPKPARRVPRGDIRRMELADVAEQVFLERGFCKHHHADDCLAGRRLQGDACIGISPARRLLFAEIISRKAARISGPESALARDGHRSKFSSNLDTALLSMMTRSDTSSLFRVVVAEAPRSPELAAIFYGTWTRRNAAKAYRLFACCDAPRRSALSPTAPRRETLSRRGGRTASSVFPDRTATNADLGSRDPRTCPGRDRDVSRSLTARGRTTSPATQTDPRGEHDMLHSKRAPPSSTH